MRYFSSLCLLLAILAHPGANCVADTTSKDTGMASSAIHTADQSVYYTEGTKRCHVADCRRYKRLSPEQQAKMVKTTLSEAEAKGLPLCSRCPGSTTHGKGNPKGGGLKSWVNPAPSEIARTDFEPSPLASSCSSSSSESGKRKQKRP